FQLPDNPLQYRVVDVQIVGVQLNGITPALSGIDGFIPAASYPEISPRRNDMEEPRIGRTPQDLRRPIRRMVVHDYHVEAKIRLLIQNAPNRIKNRLLTVSNRYDDTRLDRKIFHRRRNRPETRLQERTRSFEIFRGNVFHLDLVIAVTR